MEGKKDIPHQQLQNERFRNTLYWRRILGPHGPTWSDSETRSFLEEGERLRRDNPFWALPTVRELWASRLLATCDDSSCQVPESSCPRVIPGHQVDKRSLPPELQIQTQICPVSNDALPTASQTHPPTHPVFTEHLLCAKHHVDTGDTAVNRPPKISASRELAS